MTDELLAYLLDDLSAERRAEVEQRLAVDPAWRRERERLQQCLAATGDPQSCVDEPPVDLVKRTCGLVERAGSFDSAERRRYAGAVALTATTEPIASPGSRWSLTDCTVCAGVLGVLAMLMLPAMRESRDAARRQVCQARLGALGTVLWKYSQNHGRKLPEVNPGEPAGIYAVELAERAGVPREELEEIMLCPASEEARRRFEGEAAPHIPSRAELATARGPQWVLLVKAMGGSFAYRLGYYDRKHKYHFTRFTGGQDQPLSADAPSVTSAGVASINHAGGHNVLDQSLRVVFRTNNFWNADSNIFLNAAGRPAAGEHYGDVVLTSSHYGPDGPIVELRAE
jgi:hypothetical protein